MPIKINGATSGSTTITAPATGSDETIELSTALAGKGDYTNWTSYTPTWTTSGAAPTLGNGTLTGRYSVIGKMVTIRVNLTWGSTTSSPANVLWFFSTPSGLSVSANPPASIGSALILDAGNRFFTGACRAVGGSIVVYAGSLDAELSKTNPMTWANNDFVSLTYTYEID